ncbi:MAG: hypothetical protein OXN21_01280 [Chloroflexota bacterium]|nr:hypothetical protein [Chloroflexota bacterium]
MEKQINRWVLLALTVLLSSLWIAACTREADPPAPARPDDWPVPPLPVMALKHPSGTVWGSPSTYCWRFESRGERTCSEADSWSGITSYPEAVPGRQIHIRIDAETLPENVFAQIYSRNGNILVDFRETNTEYPILDIDLDPGDYHIRVIGQWQYWDGVEYNKPYNEVAYEFGLNVPGEVALRSECANTLVGGDLAISLNSLDDPLRTAMDNSNGMSCKFNKPVSGVHLVLKGEDGVTYMETFNITPSTSNLGFPLPENAASERNLEALPPGIYSRRMVALAEDGDEWEITSHGDFLRSITIENR